MRLQIVKQNGVFVIQNPPKDLIDRFYIEIKHENMMPIEDNSQSVESNTFEKIKKLYDSFPEDAFVQSLMESTPPSYSYKIEQGDDDLLFDALKERREKIENKAK